METLDDKKFNCTGCGGCVNTCPTKAIRLLMNDEGFYQYHIDKEKCIKCGKCIKICPKIQFENSNKESSLECIVAYSKDGECLEHSSSGGLFYEFAKAIINDGGMVAGVIYNNNNPKHILIDNLKDLSNLQGSKYLQSNVGNIYQEIQKEIKKKKILFSGTPCQCAAIKKIINNDNLITIDIVCHGVPSKKVFLKSLTDRFKNNVDYVNFRDKKTTWIDISISYFSKQKCIKSNTFVKDEWFSGYLKNLYLMKSCYSCEFNKLSRVGDITLADAWGIENIDKKFFKQNNNRGISLVLLNNESGKKLFNKVNENIIYKKQSIDKYRIYNPRIFNGIYSNEMLIKRNNYFEKEIDISFKERRYSTKNFTLIVKKLKKIIKTIIRR